MFDRFSDRARKLCSGARQAALDNGVDYIGTEHLLLGLLRLDGGNALEVVKRCNVRVADLIDSTLARLKRCQGSDYSQLPFTPRAKKALECAIDEARSNSQNYVGTEHLLIGLIREGEGIASHVLHDFGITLDSVRTILDRDKPQFEVLKETDLPPYQIVQNLTQVLDNSELSSAAATELMQAIMSGRVPPASLAAILIALRTKGESVNELAAFAKVMREAAVPIQSPIGTLDTCGTGGDASETFNISTATAFVVAGMGIPVAKHGGRSVSSKTGSADVLKALGVNIDAKVDCVQRCLDAADIAFMFAPNHHPAMKHVAPVRKELGVRTVFNLLGPLSNPANAKLQVLGVYHPSLCEKFARVLQQLGSQSAMVVCGAGPEPNSFLDEVSTFGPTTIARLKNDKVTTETLNPAQLGLPKPTKADLRASDAESSATIIRALLKGEPGRPARSWR